MMEGLLRRRRETRGETERATAREKGIETEREMPGEMEHIGEELHPSSVSPNEKYCKGQNLFFKPPPILQTIFSLSLSLSLSLSHALPISIINQENKQTTDNK